MIGQFHYAEKPCDQHVVVWMEWLNGLPSARVDAPSHVFEQLEEMNLAHVAGTMGLEFALGYGVMIAALAKAKLTLSGDMSAWPAEWGDLSQIQINANLPPDRAH